MYKIGADLAGNGSTSLRILSQFRQLYVPLPASATPASASRFRPGCWVEFSLYSDAQGLGAKDVAQRRVMRFLCPRSLLRGARLAKLVKSFRSQNMQRNLYFNANIGADTAENERTFYKPLNFIDKHLATFWPAPPTPTSDPCRYFAQRRAAPRDALPLPAVAASERVFGKFGKFV